jgi:hypothetical protein
MIWAGFIIGLLGSLHCIGMCGPLALALPATRTDFVTGRIIYNAGRVVTYMLLGTIFGIVGQTFALAGFQRGLSIAAGLFMLAAAFGWHRLAAPPVSFLRGAWSRLIALKTRTALFGIGLLNGLLPCGLVYVALAGAAATGSALRGLLFMAGFGLGTIPAMLAVSLSGKMIHAGLRLKFQRIVPAALFALSVLFILRGLSLGIPYLSPDLHAGAESCCRAGM